MLGKMLVSLDSILDVKLAILSDLNIQAMPEILNTYYNREHDEFSLYAVDLIDQAAYVNAYNARSTKELYRSNQTGIVHAMRMLLTNVTKGPWYGMDITINCYPYNLNDDDRQGIIASIVEQVGCNVSIMSISDKMLTPKIVGEYDCYIAYDLLAWLETVGDTITESKIKTTCYYPMLRKPDVIAKNPQGKPMEGEALKRVNTLDPWDALDIIYCNYVTTKALPTSFFSGLPNRASE